MQNTFSKKEKLFLLHLKMVCLHCLNNIHQIVIRKKMNWIHQNFYIKDLTLSSFQRKEKTKKEEIKNIVSELNRLVLEKDKIINKELFKK